MTYLPKFSSCFLIADGLSRMIQVGEIRNLLASSAELEQLRQQNALLKQAIREMRAEMEAGVPVAATTTTGTAAAASNAVAEAANELQGDESPLRTHVHELNEVIHQLRAESRSNAVAARDAQVGQQTPLPSLLFLKRTPSINAPRVLNAITTPSFYSFSFWVLGPS